MTNKNVFQEDLGYGDVTPSVGKMQVALIHKGFLGGRRDNAFGPKTRTAVKKFQRSRGWKGNSADGLPGPQTVALLGLIWNGPRIKDAVIPATPVTIKSADTHYKNNLSLNQLKARYNKSYKGSPITSGLCLLYAQRLTKSKLLSPSARAYQAYITPGRKGRKWINDVPAGSVALLDYVDEPWRYAYGHAVAAAGGNKCWSTDSPKHGFFTLTTYQAIEANWGMKFVGSVPRILP